MRIHKGAFLVATVGDSALLDSILDDLSVRGPKVEPALFTPKMIERTRLRFYFASLRLSNGDTIEHVGSRSGPIRRAALRLTGVVPRRLARLRLGLYCAVMRPFDILPTIWYRLCGSAWVLLKEKLSGRSPA
jgi:hypothetical protein